MVVDVFSVSAFFIVLREVLEACLVVGIVLAYLNKAGATQMRRYVWWGAGLGVAVSLLFGIVFGVIYYTTGRKVFAGNAEKIFEGIVFLVAAALLTWMILWMATMGKALQAGIEGRVESIIGRDATSGRVGIFAMVFVQVLREGIETWIFLFGVGLSEGSWRSIPIPGILAIVVGLACAYVLFRGLATFNIGLFFLLSTVILMMFSAGLVSHAFHELQEASWFGAWTKENVKTRDWWNARMWSTKMCCHDKENQFFAFLRALFGYQDTPTFVEWATYFAYWLVIAVILISTNWGAVRAARAPIAFAARAFTSVALSVSFVGFIYAVSNPTWIGVLTMTLALLLSVAATLIVFDIFSAKLRSLARMRRPLTLVFAVCLTALTLFMAALHIAQMACDDRTRCYLPRFYYLGLIFSEKWASTGRAADGNSWISIAVLAWSLVGVVFLFGSLSFCLYVFAGNVEPDGEYTYEVAPLKESGDLEGSQVTDGRGGSSMEY